MRTAPGTWEVDEDGLIFTKQYGEIPIGSLYPVNRKNNGRFIIIADHHFDAMVEALGKIMSLKLKGYSYSPTPFGEALDIAEKALASIKAEIADKEAK